MTEIYLVRHGESLGNAAKVYLGHGNWDLSETGFRQAEITAEELGNIDFSVIYSSDLIRAVHTAEPHARLRNMDIVKTSALREIYLGEWEETEVAKLRLDERFTEGWCKNFGTFCPPGGESVFDAAGRVYAELERIALESDGKCVLCVMHAAVIRAFWALASGFEPAEWCERVDFPANASWSHLRFENGNFTLLEYSQSGYGNPDA